MFNTSTQQIPLGQSSCVLMICPDDRKFTKPVNLRKIVNALRLANFSKVGVIIDDGELQALNKEIKQGLNLAATEFKSHKDLRNESTQKGREWVNKNLSILNKLPSVTIHHWDDIITNNKNFSNFYSKAEELYKRNEHFRAAIDESMKPYLTKYVSNPSTKQRLSYEQAKKICLNYKLSEVAGLYIKQGLYTFLAYPGNLCPGLQYALDHFINKNNKELVFLKINLPSQIQKILLYHGVPLINSVETSNSVIKTQSINLSTIVGHSQHTFFKPHPIFTQVEFLLQNCKNPKEMMFYVAMLNAITTKYMLANTMADDQKNKENNRMFSQENIPSGSTKTDGGLVYTNYQNTNK